MEHQSQISSSAIMKMAEVRFETETTSLLEQIIEYLGIVNRIFHYKLNIFVNLKLFLSKEAIYRLYEYVFYNKIPLLLIEGSEGESLLQEKKIIIDVDKCTLEI